MGQHFSPTAPDAASHAPVVAVVVGVGYVGLELSQTLATKNFEVVAFDVNPDRVRYVNTATPSNVTATTDPASLAPASLFCVCVPTPMSPDGKPDERYLREAAALIESVAKPGASVVVESSVAPGATRRIFGGLRDRGVHVCFSPERVDPGRVDAPQHAIPKLLGGLDDASFDACSAFYERIFDTVVRVSSAEVAEFSKLYENTFRLLNIAFANEIAGACETLGIDHAEVMTAVATKPFGLSGPFSAGLGAGGPCLPANAAHLVAHFDLPLLKNAAEACAARPAQKAAEFVNFARSVCAKNVFLYGMAFKKNVDTLASSPALAFAREVTSMFGDGNVTVYDPLVESENTVHGVNVSEDWVFDAVNADIVVVLVPHDHRETKSIDVIRSAKKHTWTVC